MQNKYTYFFAGLFACLIPIVALLPLFHPGFFPIHDNEQIGRLFELNKSLHAGEFPVKMAQDLGFGYDYPLFIFYPSFVYYIAEIFVLIGFSYITATKLMIGLGFILASFFMYLFSKKYFGVLGGLMSAVAYTYAPYHSVDVYVRGALPEFWCFVFVPAIFWSLSELHATRKSRYILISALSIAALVLTHNLVAFMSCVFIGSYWLYLLLQTKEKKSFFIQSVLAGLSGMLLPAYFWLPSFFEKQYTMISLLTKGLANYTIHFVYPIQLWNSLWGYGGSVAGQLDGLSFQIGKIQIILSVITLIIGGLLMVRKRKLGQVIFLFVILLFVSLYMSTYLSKPIWDHAALLWYIQFPWRYLLFSEFFLAFLCAGLFILPFSRVVRFCLLFFFSLGILYYTGKFFQPVSYIHVTDASYTDRHVLEWDTSKIAAEYVPNGVTTVRTPLGTSIINVSESQIAKNSYQILSGQMQTMVLRDDPEQKRFRISVTKPGTFRLNTYSFPGWKIYLNNQEVPYMSNNSLKLMTIQLDRGVYTLTARMTNTKYQILGDILSFIGILVTIGSIVTSRKLFHNE